MKLLLSEKDVLLILKGFLQKEFPSMFPGEIEISGLTIYTDVKASHKQEETPNADNS